MNDTVAKRYDGSTYTKFPIKILKTEIQKSSMPDWLKTKFYRMVDYKKPKRPQFIYVGDIILLNYESPMEFTEKSCKAFTGLSLKSTQVLEEYLEQRGMFLQWVQYKKAGYIEARYFHNHTNSDKIKKSLESFKEWRDKQDLRLFSYNKDDRVWLKQARTWMPITTLPIPETEQMLVMAKPLYNSAK